MLAVSIFWKTLPVVAVVVGVCVWAIRRFDLPFVTGLYFKTLAAVAILVSTAWLLVRTLSDYEPTNADFGGTIISSLIFAYLVHLWIMPMDDVMFDDPLDKQDTAASSTALDTTPGDVERGAQKGVGQTEPRP